MRDLIINFVEGGEVVSGLNEDRNFYFFELEEISIVIKRAVDLGGKQITKRVQILLYGEIVCDEDVVFKGEDLQKQLLSLLDKKDRSTIENIKEKEEEYIKDEKFSRFIVRYDEVLCTPETKPIPFFMNINQSLEVYTHISKSVGHLFYSKLANIIATLEGLNNLVVKLIYDDDTSDLQKGFSSFLEDENRFAMYCNYVPAKLNSLSADRIGALYPNYRAYQRYQDVLFKHLINYFEFDYCYTKHLALLSAFEEEFHVKLFDGDILMTDDDFNLKVLNPVINSFFEELVKEAEELVHKEGLDDHVLQRIYEF